MVAFQHRDYRGYETWNLVRLASYKQTQIRHFGLKVLSILGVDGCNNWFIHTKCS